MSDKESKSEENTESNAEAEEDKVELRELSDEEIAEMQRLRSEYLHMIAQSKVREDVEAPSLWLITFTDIMALMLTFFVLLYSMSVPQVEKWSTLTTGLNQSFSKFYSKRFQSGPQDNINIQRVDLSEALNLNYLVTIFEDAKERDERLKDIVIIPQKGRLIVSLPQDAVFDVGKTEVELEGKKTLYAVADILARIRNRVEVIGHTDPQPVTGANSAISSNWELSLARADEVARILRGGGYGKPIIVRGLSSARYQELPEKYSEEERLSFARRVDVVIMKDDGGQRFFMEMNLK